MSQQCPFCSITDEDIILQNNLWFALWDKYPVSKGHLLIIPLRHIISYFDTTMNEKKALLYILDRCKQHLDKSFHPDGYNIGMNLGLAAGQTVMHFHIHVIPRYIDDLADPEGGVRGVIPTKQKYR